MNVREGREDSYYSRKEKKRSWKRRKHQTWRKLREKEGYTIGYDKLTNLEEGNILRKNGQKELVKIRDGTTLYTRGEKGAFKYEIIGDKQLLCVGWTTDAGKLYDISHQKSLVTLTQIRLEENRK